MPTFKHFNATIAAYSLLIPQKLRNKGLEAFLEFLKFDSLQYALADYASFFYVKHVCEFYYTSTYNKR